MKGSIKIEYNRFKLIHVYKLSLVWRKDVLRLTFKICKSLGNNSDLMHDETIREPYVFTLSVTE